MLFQRLIRLMPWALPLGLIAQIALTVLAWNQSNGHLPAFAQAAARMTGEVSLFFFLLLTIQATTHPGFDREQAYFRPKFLLFRDLAIMHLIHLVWLMLSMQWNHSAWLPIRATGGAIAYLLIFALPVMIETQRIKEKTLVNWQNIHLFWVWLVFTMTYTNRLSGANPQATGSLVVWWPLFILLIVLIFWRSMYMLLRQLEARKKPDAEA